MDMSMTKQEFIYLDHAAATPLDNRVLEAMLPYYTDKFYNPSALYLPAQAVAKDIAAARAGVAMILGSRPSEIVFTAGGTEANNLAIHGIMRRYPGANIVISAIEHDSVLEPATQYDNCRLTVNAQGMVDIASLRAAINDKTVLISIMYANNEIGSVQPIKDVSKVIKIVKKERHQAGNTMPLYFHTDAAQASNYLDLHVARLGVDLMTLNGGKIYGPKQSGVLYVRGGTILQPLISGGGQEHGVRSGTENVAACIGFAKALMIAQEMRHTEGKRLQELQSQLLADVAKLLPTAVVNGSLKKRLPNNVHLTFPGTDNERLLLQLEEQRILSAAGSACSASNDEPSHVLRAIGLSDKEAQSSLRFTMGRATTRADVAITVQALATILIG
jgi:cysteine desulfurase